MGKKSEEEFDIAYKKACKIAAMLGVQIVTENKDGSTTTTKPKPLESNEVNMADIVKVILE